jgi:hypothetical protein
MTWHLREVVEVVEEDASRRQISEATAALARAVKEALDLLDPEQPEDEWWFDGEGAASDWAYSEVVRAFAGVDDEDVPQWHYLRERARLVVEALGEEYEQAFLVAFCPERSQRLRVKSRKLLRRYLREWGRRRLGRDAFNRLVLETDENHETVVYYPPSYESPRERELKTIISDREKSEDDRADAADQLWRIEEKRREDRQKRENEWRGDTNPGGVGGKRKRGEPFRFQPRNPCQKHKIRGCSMCHHRKVTTTPVADFALLAHQEGYEPGELAAPFGRGRQSAAERKRYEALVQVVVKLYDGEYTMEAIGRAIGRDRAAISKLIKAR